MNLEIQLYQLPHAEGIDVPKAATVSAAGLDLRAATPIGEPWTIMPGQRKLIPTGLQIAIPEGYEGQVRPRSGLANKNGVTVLNTPGTIDADYRGEIQVLLINHGDVPFVVERGDRIAQLVVAAFASISWSIVTQPDILPSTNRGSGGYGSTGKT